MSGNLSESTNVKILPSIIMLFNTSIPQIQLVNGILQDSLLLIFKGLPFSLQKEDHCHQSKISLNSILIRDSFRSCLTNSITINLLGFDASLLMNSAIAIIRFELSYFGDLYQTQSSAVVNAKNDLQVMIISNSIDLSHSLKADRLLIASVSSSNSSILLPALKLRISQVFLSFSFLYMQETDLIIRITIPNALDSGRAQLIFTAFSLTTSVEVELKQIMNFSCPEPCYKNFTGGILAISLSKPSSIFAETSEFIITMQNEFLQVTSFDAAIGSLKLLVPSIPLNTMKDANDVGQIFSQISVQHSKLLEVQFNIKNFYYQLPIKVLSGIFDSSGSQIFITLNQKVVSGMINCKFWFQITAKLGEGWECSIDSESSIRLVLGTGASIIPADTLQILAALLRPIHSHDSSFKNSEMVFPITAPEVPNSNTVVLEGSQVIDPCSTVTYYLNTGRNEKLCYIM